MSSPQDWYELRETIAMIFILGAALILFWKMFD